MRIVAGEFGGRRLNVPQGRDVRPTSDKVRGAIFNALSSRGVIEGAHVLDCFCGSGALGLEAISRGAAGCMFIDKARASVDLARLNAQELGAMERSSFLLKDVTKLAPRSAEQAQSALVFLDPPYGHDLVMPTLESLAGNDWLADGAMIVIEEQRQFDWAGHPNFEALDERIYKDTKVIYARYNAPPE